MGNYLLATAWCITQNDAKQIDGYDVSVQPLYEWTAVQEFRVATDMVHCYEDTFNDSKTVILQMVMNCQPIPLFSLL